jgi:hypothetical protein
VVATFRANRKRVTISRRLGKTANSKGLRVKSETNRITNPPSMFMARKTSIKKVGRGINITAKIRMTEIPSPISVAFK